MPDQNPTPTAAPDLSGMASPGAANTPLSAPAGTVVQAAPDMAPPDISAQPETGVNPNIPPIPPKGGTPVGMPNPVPHARLLAMVEGLSVGLSAASKSIATHGREGGAPDVQQFYGEQEAQKQRATAATTAQKNAELQQQLTTGEINRVNGANLMFNVTWHDQVDESHFRTKAAGLAVTKEKLDLFAGTGMTPEQIDQLTADGPVDAQTSSTLRANASRQAQYSGLPADTPSIVNLQKVLADPNSKPQDLLSASRSVELDAQGQQKLTDVQLKQQAAAEAAPFGQAKADSYNAGLLARYRVLNPAAKTLPASSTVSADTTPKEFDRIDRIMQQTESAQGTKAQRDLSNQMREEMLNLAKGVEIPGDESKTGAEYLVSLPAGLRGTVTAIGEGRAAPPPAGSRSPAAQSILGALNRAYPNYDATRYSAYAAMRKDFTSGKTSQGVASLNQVAGHLSRMLDHTNAWATLPGLKSLSALSGGDASALNSDKQAVATELAKAYANGTITEGEINEWNKRLNVWSPLNLKANIKEIGHLLEGALSTQQNKWDNGMPAGVVAPIAIISPTGRAALDHITGQTNSEGSSGQAVSLKAAMALPVNAGKTEDQVRADIIAHGHQVGQ